MKMLISNAVLDLIKAEPVYVYLFMKVMSPLAHEAATGKPLPEEEIEEFIYNMIMNIKETTPVTHMEHIKKEDLN